MSTALQTDIAKNLRDTRIHMEKYSETYFARDIQTEGFIVQRDGDRMANGEISTNAISTNVPHVVIHHSPTGFEWGYGGSGPADLALNILEVYLRLTDFEGARIDCFERSCFALAWVLHQEFKGSMVANIPDRGETIEWELVDLWVKSRLNDEVIQKRLEYLDQRYEV